MSEKLTALIIGAGTAGGAAARSLVRSGWRVVQIERSRWGGTCLWRGCIPKKSLYTSAAAMRLTKNAEQFGIVPTGVQIDWQSVLAWKWHAQETYAGDQERIARDHGIELVHGDARFVSPTEVQVASKTYSANHIVIATGSEPVVPDIPGAELADSSDDALRYDSVPDSLAIVGGGFIGLEMAAIFASFGTKVAVLTHASRILATLDAELAETARRHLAELGVAFGTDVRVERIEGHAGSLEVSVSDSGGSTRTLHAQRVLMATGRRPAVEDLDLQAAGVETDERGRIVVDEYLRTSKPHIWVAGDVADGPMHTPIAGLHGRAVADSIGGSTLIVPDHSCVPVACFTLPQLATVGLDEESARAKGHRVRISRTGLDSVGAAIIEDGTDGFFKFVIDVQDGRLLGAQAAGPSASDIIYAAAVALKAGLTAEQLGEVLAVHPSHAEALSFSAV